MKVTENAAKPFDDDELAHFKMLRGAFETLGGAQATELRWLATLDARDAAAYRRGLEDAANVVDAKWRAVMPPPQMGDGQDAMYGYAFKDVLAAIRKLGEDA